MLELPDFFCTFADNYGQPCGWPGCKELGMSKTKDREILIHLCLRHFAEMSAYIELSRSHDLSPVAIAKQEERRTVLEELFKL
jgi:hypothetical protein